MAITNVATPDIVARIRFLLLNVSSDMLSDTDIEYVYNTWYSTYEPDNALILPYTLYDTVISLCTRLVLLDPDGVAGKERKERVGSVSVEVKTSDAYRNKWQRLSDYYISYPTEIDPALNVMPMHRVIVGGVSHKEHHRVEGDLDSIGGGYGVNEVYPKSIRYPNRRTGYFLPTW